MITEFSFSFSFSDFMWQCSQCVAKESCRYKLLKHYKLHHCFGNHYVCIYLNCPCTFKTWAGLKTHVYRVHPLNSTQTATHSCAFRCELCNRSDLSTEKDLFIHIGTHLKNNETVTCVFLGCSFKTNILSSFYSHKKRKHNSQKDFKAGLTVFADSAHSSEDLSAGSSTDVSYAEVGPESVSESDDLAVVNLPKLIEQKIAVILLKLEHIYHIPARLLDELLEKLHFLLSSACAPLTKRTLSDIFKSHNLQISQAVTEEFAKSVCVANPVAQILGKYGPLATS